MSEFTLVLCGDLHCGHVAGLTPPDWQLSSKSGNERRRACGKLQKEMWSHYMALVDRYHRPNAIIVNGDVIDGIGAASGGTELMTADLNEQVEMAIDALAPWDANRYLFTYGTQYHVSNGGQDTEKQVADAFGAIIGSHIFPKAGGKVFDIKHHSGGTSIPHGTPPLKRAHIWNLLWNEEDQQPLGDITIRSHIHRFHYGGDHTWLGMTLPALQAAHTKFGARRCEGTVHWGIVVFKFTETKDGISMSWKDEIIQLEEQKQETIVL